MSYELLAEEIKTLPDSNIISEPSGPLPMEKTIHCLWITLQVKA